MFRPMEFIECEDLVDLKGNKTRDDTITGGCSKVQYCRVYNNIYLIHDIL